MNKLAALAILPWIALAGCHQDAPEPVPAVPVPAAHVIHDPPRPVAPVVVAASRPSLKPRIIRVSHPRPTHPRPTPTDRPHRIIYETVPPVLAKEDPTDARMNQYLLEHNALPSIPREPVSGPVSSIADPGPDYHETFNGQTDNVQDARGQAVGGQVWVNTRTGIYHYPGTRWYGATAEGHYMSESEARSQGYVAAANGQ